MTAPAPLLVLAVGNPSRGDDALGSLFIERLSEELAPEVSSGEVELLVDYQLQIEHALDVSGRQRVVFVDASVSAAAPFEFSRVVARRDTPCSTHALSPEALLATHHAALGEPPESWALAIRGEHFELGDPLSGPARSHLDAALAFFVAEARSRSAVCVGQRIDVEGIVQGVGFRPWVYRVARRLGLTGAVWNTARGVAIEAFGSGSALSALLRAIQTDAPRAAQVRAVRVSPPQESAGAPAHDAGGPASGFRIAHSETEGREVASSACVAFSLPADLATCDACLGDVNDPGDRHYGYAFTSCTECGPRLAIARGLPFDRATTTLSSFSPCPACAAEYGCADERRFHAQTIACPACGPRVWLADTDGTELPGVDPIERAAALLCAGKILGVQGLGAFHLVCDATDATAVSELRRRKRRDAQPFAVMVENLRAAEDVAELDDRSRAALCSSARPIVLLPERCGRIAREVNGPSRRTGVLLPYTPLHARLVAAAGRPLVVTSGNPSGGPAVIEHAAARAELGGLVDAFLFHDRSIARRVEDSVVAPSPAGLRVVRRARGFAPEPIRLPASASEPVLAVGGHMKNTACVVVGDLAYLTPHLGDLELVESEAAWQRDVESFERLLGVRPEIIAHDLHPDYASTRFALSRPARRRIGVQHHVAHVLAAVAELHLNEPVVGVAFDGTGWGPDGSAWGAEILLLDGLRWSRVNSFRALPLPGGERAIREVWRVALATLVDTFGVEEAVALAGRLRVFDAVPRRALDSVGRGVAAGVACVPARGMGRWFDAIGALALELPRAGFDGHVAVALEEVASGHLHPGANASGDVAAYPVVLPAGVALDEPVADAHEVDLRPAVRAVVSDLLDGAAPGLIAARFHASVVEATSTVVARVLAATGLRRVVLTGGCFQNRILEEGLTARLGRANVTMAREVPVNDGGLALGQAWAAVLALRSGQG